MTEFKDGKICITCGNTKRYKNGGACVRCSIRRSSDRSKNSVKGVWIHRLSNRNIEAKEAFCAACGLVKIRLKGKVWRCKEALKIQKGRYYYKQKIRKVGICDICEKEKPLCYDHDHKTGKHRGWLCHHCNVGIGFLQDSTEILKTAIDYLQKS